MKFLNIYLFVLFFLFISSMHPWFTWGIDVYISILGAASTFFAILKGYIRINLKNFYYSILFFVLTIWTANDFNIFGFLKIVLNWFIILGLISLKPDIRSKCISYITKYLSILLGVSLVAFFLFLLGLDWTHYEVQHEGSLATNNNYYFFISGVEARFYGPFLEPGFVTMGIAPLLFLNKYNLRNKFVFILFVAQLFTFSIAGFVLLVLGYLFIVQYDKKRKNKPFRLLLAAVIGLFSFFALLVIFGEEIVSNYIIDRFAWTGTTIQGDNRSSDYLDYVYDKVINSNMIWTGTHWDAELSEKGVAGYKLFIVKNGLVGLLLAILSYFTSLLFLKKIRLFNVFFVLFLLLILFQNAYPLMWCLLICLFFSDSCR